MAEKETNEFQKEDDFYIPSHSAKKTNLNQMGFNDTCLMKLQACSHDLKLILDLYSFLKRKFDMSDCYFTSIDEILQRYSKCCAVIFI